MVLLVRATHLLVLFFTLTELSAFFHGVSFHNFATNRHRQQNTLQAPDKARCQQQVDRTKRSWPTISRSSVDEASLELDVVVATEPVLSHIAEEVMEVIVPESTSIEVKISTDSLREEEPTIEETLMDVVNALEDSTEASIVDATATIDVSVPVPVPVPVPVLVAVPAPVPTTSFTGTLVNGRAEGYGTFTNSKGHVLVGHFHLGNIVNGTGTMLLASSGTLIEGTWVEGKLRGQAKMVFKNGTVKQGFYFNSDLNGFGSEVTKSGRNYTGEFLRGAKHGHGTYRDAKGVVYEGQWVDDVRHGAGTMTYPDGIQYVCQWRDNAKVGEGVYITAGGLRVEGNFVNNTMQGEVTMRSPRGDVYVGNASKGMKHGHGRMQFADGSSYEGQYRHNLQHGYGVQTYSNNASYRGYWARNKRHGTGRCVSSAGEVCEGVWEEDRIVNGTGVLHQHRCVASGTWVNGLLEGLGTLNATSTNYYLEGTFERGNLNGNGTEIMHGVVYTGRFSRGEKFGNFSVLYPDGSLFTAEYMYNKRHGFGTHRYVDNSVYTGMWKRHRAHGHGTRVYPGNGTYIGEYYEDARHGQGVLCTKDNLVYAGEFREGRLYTGHKYPLGHRMQVQLSEEVRQKALRVIAESGAVGFSIDGGSSSGSASGGGTESSVGSVDSVGDSGIAESVGTSGDISTDSADSADSRDGVSSDSVGSIVDGKHDADFTQPPAEPVPTVDDDTPAPIGADAAVDTAPQVDAEQTVEDGSVGVLPLDMTVEPTTTEPAYDTNTDSTNITTDTTSDTTAGTSADPTIISDAALDSGAVSEPAADSTTDTDSADAVPAAPEVVVSGPLPVVPVEPVVELSAESIAQSLPEPDVSTTIDTDDTTSTTSSTVDTVSTTNTTDITDSSADGTSGTTGTIPEILISEEAPSVPVVDTDTDANTNSEASTVAAATVLELSPEQISEPLKENVTDEV